jgi:hypothetical protein
VQSGSSSVANKSNQISLTWLLISLAGFVCYALFNRQVFPAASINYNLNQDQAAIASKSIASQFGYDINKSIQTTVFMTDDDAKTVLEFKLGIKKANELMKNDVPVWLWRTRFCKELSKDQLYVAWTTSGQLKSVAHIFENDLKLPPLSKPDALELAKKFVRQTGKQDLTGYELFDYGTETKPNRLDQHFEWRKGGYPDSTLRLRVEIAGNQISAYKYYLAPSDVWSREYKKIREDNELLGKIASFFIFVFIVATIGAFVHGLNTHNIRWRFVLTCSSIVALLFVLDQGNNWNNTIDSSYDTSISFANFVAREVLHTFFFLVGVFLISISLVGGAETIYRRTWPKHMAMPYLLSLRGMAQPDYFRKTIYGYLIVGGMMLWVISYYMVGEKFNFFCPLGVDDYKAVGTVCPAVSAALIGVSAAGLEEFACRVVGLGLLKKLLRNFWLANILQAMVWGFAHSQYPQQPSYARGIELSVVGLVFGWIINTYGILPCFVAHYLYDAFLTVEPVFATHQLLLTIPAMFVLVPFLMAALFSKRWARKNDIPEVDLSNAAMLGPNAPEVHQEHEIDRSETKYAPLSQKKRRVLLVVAFVCFGAAFISTANPIGADKKVTVGKSKALQLAKQYLQEDGIVDAGYLSEVEMLAKPDQSEAQKWQHVFEQAGRSKTLELYDQVEPCLEWRVKFFKPLDPQSYLVFMNGDGRKRVTVNETIDDGTGKKLDESAALLLVDNYLKKYRPEYTPYVLVDKNKVEHSHRTDYKFDLHVPHLDAGSTLAILHAEVKGDQISDFQLDWEIPDAWSWPRTKGTWYQQANGVLRPIFFLLVLVVLAAWGLYVLRATKIRWQGPLLMAAVASSAAAISIINSAPKLLFSYNTAETLTSFLAQSFAVEAAKVMLFSCGYLLLCLTGFATVRICFPAVANQLRHKLLLQPKDSLQRVVRSDICLDATLSSYAFCSLLFLFKFIQAVATEPFSPVIPIEIPRFMPAMFSTSSASVDLLASIVGAVIAALMILALVAGIWTRFMQSKVKSTILIVFAGVIYGASSWCWQEFLSQFLFTVAFLWTALFFTVRIFRMNLISYVFVTLEIVAGLRLAELVRHGSRIGAVEIGIMLVFICLPLLATTVVWCLDHRQKIATEVAS